MISVARDNFFKSLLLCCLGAAGEELPSAATAGATPRTQCHRVNTKPRITVSWESFGAREITFVCINESILIFTSDRYERVLEGRMCNVV